MHLARVSWRNDYRPYRSLVRPSRGEGAARTRARGHPAREAAAWHGPPVDTHNCTVTLGRAIEKLYGHARPGNRE
jgi:hypothetical protein